MCRSHDEIGCQALNFKTPPLSYLTVTAKSMQSKHDFMSHRRSFLRTSAAGVAGAVGWAGGASSFAQSGSIRVAAASDLKFALIELATEFEKETGDKLVVTFGSSGNLARQLEQGLPMDLFMSADESLVFRLAQSGWARDAGVVYAQGSLAWLLPQSALALVSADLTGLASALGEGGKLSIANPEHAPYGRAARAALQAAGLWQSLQSRLVLGENVSQATQFVSTGAAQAGLVALSLARAPEVAARTRHGKVDAALHPPIIQRMALHRWAPAGALRLYAYLQSPAAKKILSDHGLG
jgi:molybdate transport system substrate-binding protein